MHNKHRDARLLLRLILDFLLLCGVFCVALLLLPRTLSTVQRGFHCQDESLQYTYSMSLLSKVHLTLLVIAVPAAVLLIVEMLRAAFLGEHANAGSRQQFIFMGFRIPTFMSECYKLIGLYLFGLALQLIAVQATQRFVGRLRPYFLDVCQPQLADGGSCADAQQQSRYIVAYKCSELAASAEILATLRHSFPSGFAAAAAYAMGFLAYYLQARVTAVWLQLLRATLQFACLLLAVLVALERVSSFRNHWADVAVGLALGFAVASFIALTVARLFATPKVPPQRWKHDERLYMYGYYGARRY